MNSRLSLPETQIEYAKDLSILMGEAQVGVETAESAIHQQFVNQLVCLASRRINEKFRSKIAPEEIVQSVFASFFRRHRQGEFECENWNDLWALLVKITVCKCINKINGYKTAKRDVEREFAENEIPDTNSSFFGHASQPTAEDIAIFNESLDQLFDQIPASMQQIVCLRLEGMSNFEISEILKCSERTVYRSLDRVKQILQNSENL